MHGFDIIKLEHYADARGWNTHPVDYDLLTDGHVQNIHIVSMEPGAQRGNHIHRVQTEHIFIMGGPCLVAACDPETQERIDMVVQPGEVILFRAAPGIAHVFKSQAQTTVFALCYSDLRFDPANPDMEPYSVI